MEETFGNSVIDEEFEKGTEDDRDGEYNDERSRRDPNTLKAPKSGEKAGRCYLATIANY